MRGGDAAVSGVMMSRVMSLCEGGKKEGVVQIQFDWYSPEVTSPRKRRLRLRVQSKSREEEEEEEEKKKRSESVRGGEITEMAIGSHSLLK